MAIPNGLIDVHTHVVPPTLPEAPSAALAKRWPCMHCGEGREATLRLGDLPFRKIDDRSWSIERRLADMDAMSVDLQVLSPMPELLSYWFDVAGAERLCDSINDQIARMVSIAPARFRGLGAVTLQDPARAADQVRTMRARFGLSGVEIGSNIAGTLLEDRSLDPFWEAAEEAGAAIFVHAIHPIGRESSHSPTFTNVAMFPLEIALAAASLLMGGVCERYPALRIALSHGGGGLPGMLGRLDQGWRRSGGFEGALKREPTTTARRFYVDANVYDPIHLSQLASCIFPGRVFAGTDYPYRIMENDPCALIANARLDSVTSASVRRGAALEFLGEEGV